MDGIVRMLAALLALLNVATGAPMDETSAPDRPVIVAPATVTPSVQPSRTLEIGQNSVMEIRGTIESIQGNLIVVNGISVTVGSNVPGRGSLQPGDAIRVQAIRRQDGALEARELRVGSEMGENKTSTPVSSGMTGVKPTEKPESKTTQTPEAKPIETQVKPTEKPEVKPTEKPEVKPTEKPEAKPTEKPEVKPTEKPEGSGK